MLALMIAEKMNIHSAMKKIFNFHDLLVKEIKPLLSATFMMSSSKFMHRVKNRMV